MYFQMISQVIFEDLYDFDRISTYDLQLVHNMNNIPISQNLIHMRYHIHYQDLHMIVRYYPQNNYHCSVKRDGTVEVINLNNIVENNTQQLLGRDNSISDFNKQQLDMLAYTFPYQTNETYIMKRVDFQNLQKYTT